MAFGSDPIKDYQSSLEKAVGVIDATGRKFQEASMKLTGLNDTVKEGSEVFRKLSYDIAGGKFKPLVDVWGKSGDKIREAREEMRMFRSEVDRAVISAKLLQTSIVLRDLGTRRVVQSLSEISKASGQAASSFKNTFGSIISGFNSISNAFDRQRKYLFDYNRALFEVTRISNTLGRTNIFTDGFWKQVKDRTTLGRLSFAKLYQEVLEQSKGLPPTAEQFMKLAETIKNKFGGSLDTVQEKTRRFLQLQQLLPDILDRMKGFEGIVKMGGEPSGLKATVALLREMGADYKSIDMLVQFQTELSETDKALLNFENAWAKKNQAIENLNVDAARSMQDGLISIDKNMTRLVNLADSAVVSFDKFTHSLVTLGVVGLAFTSVLGGIAASLAGLDKVISGILLKGGLVKLGKLLGIGGVGGVTSTAGALGSGALGAGTVGMTTGGTVAATRGGMALRSGLMFGAGAAGIAGGLYGTAKVGGHLATLGGAYADSYFGESNYDILQKHKENVTKREMEQAKAEDERRKAELSERTRSEEGKTVISIGATLAGAGIGAVIGSIFGPGLGTYEGAGIGAGVGAKAGNWLEGKQGGGSEGEKARSIVDVTSQQFKEGSQAKYILETTGKQVRNMKETFGLLRAITNSEERRKTMMLLQRGYGLSYVDLLREIDKIGDKSLITSAQELKFVLDKNEQDKIGKKTILDQVRSMETQMKILDVLAGKAKEWKTAMEGQFNLMKDNSVVSKEVNSVLEQNLAASEKERQIMENKLRLTVDFWKTNKEGATKKASEIFSESFSIPEGATDDIKKFKSEFKGLLEEREKLEANKGNMKEYAYTKQAGEQNDKIREMVSSFSELVIEQVKQGKSYAEMLPTLRDITAQADLLEEGQMGITEKSGVAKANFDAQNASLEVQKNLILSVVGIHQNAASALEKQKGLYQAEADYIEKLALGMAPSYAMRKRIYETTVLQRREYERMAEELAKVAQTGQTFSLKGQAASLKEMHASEKDINRMMAGDYGAMLAIQTSLDSQAKNDEERASNQVKLNNLYYASVDAHKNIFEWKQKELELTMKIREGFMDVINEMTTSSGLTAKLIPNAQRGLMSLMDVNRMMKGATFGGAMRTGFVSMTGFGGPGVSALEAPRYTAQ